MAGSHDANAVTVHFVERRPSGTAVLFDLVFNIIVAAAAVVRVTAHLSTPRALSDLVSTSFRGGRPVPVTWWRLSSRRRCRSPGRLTRRPAASCNPPPLAVESFPVLDDTARGVPAPRPIKHVGL